MKKLFLYGACMLLAAGAVSCHGDDPMIKGEKAPVVKPAEKSVSGVVTDANGNPISGATVKMGDQTTTTDNNGEYTFNDVKSGSHTITVSKNGYDTQSRDIVMPDDSDSSSSVTSSFTLTRTIRATVNYSRNMTSPASDAVTSSHIVSNNEGSVKITMTVDEGTVDEDVEIYVTPIYTSRSADILDTKSSFEEMLIGATLSSSKPVTLKKPVSIRFELDNSVTGVITSKELSNGNWSASGLDANVENNDIVIKTTHFTSFGLFATIDLTETKSRKAIQLSNDIWNNCDGNKVINTGSVNYTYMSGTQISTTATNKMQGLLIEYIARNWGATASTLNGVWALNTDVNPGYAIQIWGNQDVWSLSATCNSRKVTAVRYGDVILSQRVWNRDHNGGGSNN